MPNDCGTTALSVISASSHPTNVYIHTTVHNAYTKKKTKWIRLFCTNRLSNSIIFKRMLCCVNFVSLFIKKLFRVLHTMCVHLEDFRMWCEFIPPLVSTYGCNLLLLCLGMSESSGPQTVCTPNQWNSASAGKDIVGVRTKIMDPDADGEGEV